MLDFPPHVGSFTAAARAGDEPDTRTPTAFLRWLLARQWQVIAFATLVGAVWQLPMTVGPWLFGKAVDHGILAHSASGTLFWAGLLLAVTLIGAGAGILMHTTVVRSWLIALYGTTKLVTRKSVQLGHILPRRLPTGEVLSVASADSDQFGALTEILARAGSQLIAYVVVTLIVLRTSVTLGLVVLLAAPVLVAVAMPMLRPLHARQQLERTRSSELTSMATDIVAGLRILRGIGGERTFGRNYTTQSQRVRSAGVSAGIWQAAVEATGVLLSGVFLVALIWLGTREVTAGRLTVGQLVSFLGYGLFMVTPIRTFFEFAQKWTRAVVSARKAIALLEQVPPWRDPDAPLTLPQDSAVEDALTGFVAEPGLLTVVVSAVPEEAAALADRLGRYLPPDSDPASADPSSGRGGRAGRRSRAERAALRARAAARDEARAARPWGVRIGGVDLNSVRLADVRRHVLVSDSGSQLFSGTLQQAVDPHGRLTRKQAEHALHTAAAEDVYDGLPGGWQGRIDERGRGLSGGQRQRVVLARALAADVPVLVLVEPTSAVDAHTETRISERVARARTGRTTVVTTVSPLWLHHADRVVLLAGGSVVATGTHEQLLDTDPDYRAVVNRSMEALDV
ncbi:MAG TPA: ABC transporter ATP-binding protein [Nocardioidaceae bacterium]|nr:ABC transporter ATP-binding protein [Nocardioidaceae bacterium]